MKDGTWYICLVTGCILLIILFYFMMKTWYTNGIINKGIDYYNAVVQDVYGMSAEYSADCL